MIIFDAGQQLVGDDAAQGESATQQADKLACLDGCPPVGLGRQIVGHDRWWRGGVTAEDPDMPTAFRPRLVRQDGESGERMRTFIHAVG